MDLTDPKLKLPAGPDRSGRAGFRLPTSPSRTLSLSRFRRRVLLGTPLIGALVFIAGALAWRFGGATWVVNRILDRVNPYPALTLVAARVSGNPLTSLELHDVRLTGGGSNLVARFDSAHVRYDPRRLLGDTVRIADVRVYGPWVDLRRLPDSSWNLSVPRRPSTGSPPSGGPRIAIGHVAIAGGGGELRLDTQTGRGLRLEGVDVEARELAIARGVRIDHATIRLRVQFQPRPSEWDTVEASGSLLPERIVVNALTVRSRTSAISARATIPLPRPADRTEGLAVHVDARPLALRDLSFWGTRFDRPETVVLTLDAHGEERGVALRLHSDFSDGGRAFVEGLLTLPGNSPVAYRANASLQALDPGLLTGGSSHGDRVNGRLAVDLQGPSSDQLTGRVRAEIDRSQYASLRLRRAVATADFSAGRARLDLTLESGPIGVKVAGWVRPLDTVPSYDLTALAERLRQDSTAGWLDRLVGTSGTRLSIGLVGRGVDPRRADVRALATTLPGAGPPGLIDSATVRARLSDGTAHVQGRVGATGGLVDVLGQIALEQELRYRVQRGSVEGLNLPAIFGRATESSLDGTFTLSGRGTNAASAALRADLAVARLSYGPHLLTDGRLALALSRGAADITLQANADSMPIELAATAQPFAPEPTLSVTRLRFRHADIARFVPGTKFESDLSGSAHLRLRGRRMDELRLTGGVALDLSRVATQQIDHATIDGSLARGDLDVRLRVTGPAGSVALAGSGRPLDSVPSYVLREATFRDLDLGQVMTARGLHTRLAGSLRLEGSGPRPESTRLTGMLSLEPSRFNRASIRAGHLELGMADGHVQLAGRVLGEHDSVTVDGTAEPFATPPHVRLTAAVGSDDLAALLGQDTIPASGAVSVTLEGTLGRPTELRLQGTVNGRGHYGGVAVDTLETSLRYADGSVQVDTLSLRTNVGDASGAGRITLLARDPARISNANTSDADTTNTAISKADTSTFRLEAALRDLSPVGEVLGLDGLALDTGRVTLTLRGTRDGTQVTAGIDAGDLAWGPHRVRAVDASVEGDLAADHTVLGGKGRVVLQGLSVAGRPIARVGLRGTYDARDLAVNGTVDMDQQHGAVLAARVWPDSASRRAVLDTLELKGERETWALSHPVEISFGARLRVDDFALMSGRGRFAVDGTVDPQGEQKLAVRIDSLPLGWLAGALLGLHTFDGTANGSLDLTGPAAAPRLAGDLALDLTSRSKKMGTARGRLDWTGPQGLRVELGLYHPKGDSLRLAGHVPLALSLVRGDTSARTIRPIPGGDLALDLTTRGFRIDMLNPWLSPTAKDLRGRLTADAHAGGSLQAPALSGTLDLADASVRLSRLGAKYEKGRLRTTLHGQEIGLAEAHLESGGGRVKAQGAVQLPPSAPPQFDLTADLDGFRLADAENLRATVSGSVHLKGTPAAPSLGGSVSLKNVDFYLQAKSSGQSGEDVQLTDEDLRTVQRRFGLPVDRPPVAAPSPWGLALDVELAGNDWVRRRTSPAVAVELTGKLQVRKEPGQDLLVYGSIMPVAGRSFVEMLGRRFDVKKGEVGLNGPIANAKLDLQAEYKADSGSSTSPSGVVITTALSADTGKVAVTLGSRPKLSDADIRSYLAMGRPAGTDPTQTTEETNPLAAGASLALSAALGTVAGGAGRTLGFDVIQVLQDRNGEQTLVAGKYVSPPLYLGFREPIVAGDDPTQPQSSRSTTEFEVEYAALQRALLNVQGGGNEFRVFLRLRR